VLDFAEHSRNISGDCRNGPPDSLSDAEFNRRILHSGPLGLILIAWRSHAPPCYCIELLRVEEDIWIYVFYVRILQK